MLVLILLITVNGQQLPQIRLQSTTSSSEGGLCIDSEYKCCTGYYAVGNKCLECPLGFFGINCSLPCPYGYYGRRCWSICKCSSSEICHYAFGCTYMYKHASPDCTETSCGKDIPRQTTSTDISPDEARSHSKFNYVVLFVVLGSTTFMIFLIILLLRLDFRFGTSFRGSPWRRSTNAESGREQHGGEDHNDIAYTDIQSPRMLADYRVESDSTGHEYSSAHLRKERHL